MRVIQLRCVKHGVNAQDFNVEIPKHTHIDDIKTASRLNVIGSMFTILILLALLVASIAYALNIQQRYLAILDEIRRNVVYVDTTKPP